ncbi:MAG: hypothetical protein R6U98_26170 [Pirellulaceae bacterium]
MNGVPENRITFHGVFCVRTDTDSDALIEDDNVARVRNSPPDEVVLRTIDDADPVAVVAQCGGSGDIGSDCVTLNNAAAVCPELNPMAAVP